jgi:hypothetical protein
MKFFELETDGEPVALNPDAVDAVESTLDGGDGCRVWLRCGASFMSIHSRAAVVAALEAGPGETLPRPAPPPPTLAALWAEVKAFDARMNVEGRERSPTGDDYNDLFDKVKAAAVRAGLEV